MATCRASLALAWPLELVAAVAGLAAGLAPRVLGINSQSGLEFSSAGRGRVAVTRGYERKRKAGSAGPQAAPNSANTAEAARLEVRCTGLSMSTPR